MASHRVFGIQLDGGLELLLGLLAPILVGVGHAQVEVGVGVVRIQLDRLLVLVHGHVGAVGSEEAGQVVVGRGAVRLQLQGGQVLLEGFAIQLLFAVDGREVVVGVGRFRVELDGLLELLDRLVQPAPVGQLDAAGVVLVGADRPVPVAAHGPFF